MRRRDGGRVPDRALLGDDEVGGRYGPGLVVPGQHAPLLVIFVVVVVHGQLLRRCQGVVDATLDRHQDFVRPLLDHAAATHHHDIVGLLDGGQAVCDGDGGPILRHPVQCRLHHLLATHVNGAGGLVQDENPGPLDDGPRDG